MYKIIHDCAICSQSHSHGLFRNRKYHYRKSRLDALFSTIAHCLPFLTADHRCRPLVAALLLFVCLLLEFGLKLEIRCLLATAGNWNLGFCCLEPSTLKKWNSISIPNFGFCDLCHYRLGFIFYVV